MSGGFSRRSVLGARGRGRGRRGTALLDYAVDPQKRPLERVVKSWPVIATAFNVSADEYGLRVRAEDRVRGFSADWRTVTIGPATFFIDGFSFWDSEPSELISDEIDAWLRAKGHAPWPKGRPPKFELINIKGNRFELVKTKRSSRAREGPHDRR